MELRYPITSELFTFVHSLNRAIERGLRRECNLSVVQYRALSCMRQAGELLEARMGSVMAVSAARLSQALGALQRQGLAAARNYRGPSKLWRLTPKGDRMIENADAALIEACDLVFGPLGPELGRAIRAGSMLTNQRHGVVRIEGGRFFEEHACFEAFLQAEVFTKESSREFGLTMSEFRVLFELLLSGPSTKSGLASFMVLAPSVISDACKALEERGLIASTAGGSDKRVHTIALTRAGRELAVQAAERVDARAYDDLRPSSTDERALYQRMADIFVRDNN